MEFIGHFENKFAQSYMRNHKAVTVKNLRCFPRCSLQHKDNGFCGNEVVGRWMINNLSPDEKRELGTLETYAEFQEADSQPRFAKNQKISEQQLMSLTTLMRGEVVEEGLTQGTVHFARESKGWHYGWMAGRGNGSHALHEMRVYILDRIDAHTYVCRLVMRSTPFQVTSRKRIRPKKKTASSAESNLDDSEDEDSESRFSAPERKRVRSMPVRGSHIEPVDIHDVPHTLPKPKSTSPPPVVPTINKPLFSKELPPKPPGFATISLPQFNFNNSQQQQQQQHQHQQQQQQQQQRQPTSSGQQASNSQRLSIPWTFNFGSTPPVYQHSVSPPLYKHPMSTTPPVYIPPFLFGQPPNAGDHQNPILSGMFNPHHGAGDDVLDVLWQPTPPSTFGGILMMRQQQHQQMFQQQHQQMLKGQQKAEEIAKAKAASGV